MFEVRRGFGTVVQDRELRDHNAFLIPELEQATTPRDMGERKFDRSNSKGTHPNQFTSTSAMVETQTSEGNKQVRQHAASPLGEPTKHVEPNFSESLFALERVGVKLKGTSATVKTQAVRSRTQAAAAEKAMAAYKRAIENAGGAALFNLELDDSKSAAVGQAQQLSEWAITLVFAIGLLLSLNTLL
mmetsp:Transcript_16546/g.32293  ORF Transcript_16546/g.32293 Transcript_16546/m.32293 type:complete len:187 (-) Transcript_16546:68-628(-)